MPRGEGGEPNWMRVVCEDPRKEGKRSPRGDWGLGAAFVFPDMEVGARDVKHWRCFEEERGGRRVSVVEPMDAPGE